MSERLKIVANMIIQVAMWLFEPIKTIFDVVRVLITIFGIITFLNILTFCAGEVMTERGADAIWDFNEVAQRALSPDRSRVALVYHQVKVENLFFKINIVDTALVVRTADEGELLHGLRKNHGRINGIVIRNGSTKDQGARLFIRWSAADRLNVTAPPNTHGSYIHLSGHRVDGVAVNFAFEHEH